MAVVRFYWTDLDNHIRHPPEEVECRDDAEAIAKATERLAVGASGWHIEIWDRARCIAKLSAPADVGPTPDEGMAMSPRSAAVGDPIGRTLPERLPAK